MRKSILPGIILIFSNFCNGQLVRSPLSVRYTGIGTYSKNFTDVFSFINNQAALPRIKEASAGVYSERRFVLKELSLYEAALALPFPNGGVGLTAAYSGFKNFSESQLGVAYGRTLGEKVSLGIAVNYNLIRIPGYGNAGAINCQVGSIFHLTEKLHAGWHIYNPVGGKFGKSSNEKLATIYAIGMGYEASEKFFMSAEVAKEENQPVNVNVALHYSLLQEFFIRGGISASAGNSFLGIGITWKTFRTDVALTWHQQLGFTPSFLIIFNFSKQKPPEE